jgi:polyisoprenoid-binding protein YceI
MPHYLTSYALIIMIICFPKATQLKSRIILFALVLIAGFVYASVRQVYSVKSSKVIFKSVAELETITAESTTLTGLVDPTNKNFAFSISNKSFDGFNSSLQKEHFNDNYIESDKYPTTTFTGRIIDEIDFKKPGTYVIRVKGMFKVKGVTKEELIKGTIDVTPSGLKLNTNFSLLLSDYEIRVPRIVNQKIAPEIKITIQANLVLTTIK